MATCTRRLVVLVLFSTLLTVSLSAQEPSSASGSSISGEVPAGAAVLRTVRFSGKLPPAAATSGASVVGVRFALYENAASPSPDRKSVV